MQDHGQAAYRADQVRRRAWAPEDDGFSSIRELPAALRGLLAESFDYLSLELAAEQRADHGLTRKLLLRARDGQEVEAVAIRHPGHRSGRARNTVCVSSQVGCAIGCVFCATGQLGLRRQLTAAEIVDQVRFTAALWAGLGLAPPRNVVFMGMGEPLQNYAQVLRGMRLLHEWGIAWRHMVISTSGLVAEIDRLAAERLPITLAISLLAASDALRDRLVPLNRRYPLSELAGAAIRYREATGRRVSLEYVLIAGVNDRPSDALELGRFAARLQAH
ncbi:MAG: 23S rRNA (adenine(2503)-C(2))-methyltransferase RlmN, partial [Candidatus Dormibacteria bacterium]